MTGEHHREASCIGNMYTTIAVSFAAFTIEWGVVYQLVVYTKDLAFCLTCRSRELRRRYAMLVAAKAGDGIGPYQINVEEFLKLWTLIKV